MFSVKGPDRTRKNSIFLAFLCLATIPLEGVAQDTPDYFKQNCANCHTIGGGMLTGPDLKDVTGRQPDREWLIKFMMNPRAVVGSGDTYALKILKNPPNATMPTPPNITPDRAEKLLELIEAESKLEESQFKGVQVSTEPFTDEQRDRGREIFLGLQPLEKGGAACISCHSMHDISALGGGRLGPDLTNTYKDRRSLTNWLVAPGTDTMKPIFDDHPMQRDEINALVAYFESTAAEQPANAAVSRVSFLLMGLAGAALFVFLFDAIWKRRFHAVRRPLVKALQLTR